MAITREQAEENKMSYAVTCCRYEEGTIISHDNIEDPNLIPDLEDSGLIDIPENCLKIGEAIGGKLMKTVDALTPLTKEIVEGYVLMEEKEDFEDEEVLETEVEEDKVKLEEGLVSNSSIKIKIGKGENIDIEIPFPITGPQASGPMLEAKSVGEESIGKRSSEDRVIRSLIKKYLKINKVDFEETKIEGDTLYIRDGICKDAIASQKLVVDLKIDIVTEKDYDKFTNTVMDIQPIATKLDGEVGEGVTGVLDGVVMVVTGTDEKGVQIGEFGSSEGILKDNIMWDRPGSISKGEILIKTDVTIKEGTNMERPGPMAAHKATDYISQEIREALKTVAMEEFDREEEYLQKRRAGKKK